MVKHETVRFCPPPLKENDALASTFIFIQRFISGVSREKIKSYGGHMSETKKCIQIMQRLDANLGDQYTLYKTTIGDLRIGSSRIGIQRRRQRKYLFNDIPGGPGHSWQRNVFASLLVGNPIGMFELTIIQDENSDSKEVNYEKYLIEDGQQRYFTIMAIIDNKIKLPSDLSSYGDEYSTSENKLFCDLPLQQQDEIFNRVLIMNASILKTEEARYARFIDMNKSMKLSDQDKRSGQPTKTAAYIQSIVDGNNNIEYGSYRGTTTPKYPMFQITQKGDRIDHGYIEVSATGRCAEEIIADWFSYLRYDGKEEIKTEVLDKMYGEFLEGKEITDSEKVTFEKIVSKINDLIVKYNHRKGLTKKPLDYLFPIVKRFMDSNVKIHTDSFMIEYRKAIEQLRKENETWILIPSTKNKSKNGKKNTKNKSKNGKKNSVALPITLTFDYTFRQITRNEAITYIIDKIYDRMLLNMESKGTLVLLDSKRAFTKEEKSIKLSEQNNKCASCGEYLELSDAEGDHLFPYSKGGLTETDNLIVLCEDCNNKKSDMNPEEWESVSNDNLSLAA